MPDEKKSIPLEYATPPKRRSMEKALREFVNQEMAAGRLQPNSARKNVMLWVIFFSAFAVLLLAMILMK
jgi:hypothetical protein